MNPNPTLTVAEQRALLATATAVGQRVTWQITLPSTGTYEHRYQGTVTRIIAADAGANPPVTRHLFVRIELPTSAAGREDPLPISIAGVGVTLIEVAAEQANVYLADLRALHVQAASDAPTVRNPATWGMWIMRDVASRGEAILNFEMWFRAQITLTGAKNADILLPNADFESLRVNAIVRQLVLWVRRAQTDANWQGEISMGSVHEILYELEAWDLELTYRKARAGAGSVKDGGQRHPSREDAVRDWQTRVAEMRKGSQLGDWDRACHVVPKKH